MKILAVGGGSGGHVTPVAAVYSELKRTHPEAELRFWCDSKFYHQALATMKAVDPNVHIETIVAGKLRRYHKLSFLRQLVEVRTIVLPNLVDGFKLVIGVGQSLYKLARWRPDVVFTKGGFVCLPVGLAARLLRIPLVTHDSDAHPGLTNRILAKVATSIATGAPLKYYPYPKDRTRYIGIPVASTIQPWTHAQQQAAKKRFGFDEHDPLVVITGGGLGASRLNEVTLAVLDDLTSFTSVVLVSGTAHEAELKRATKRISASKFKLYGYVAEGMLDLLGAADIVVSRAGATTLLELAALAKPTIIIPNENLTGGHQTKNAAVYAQAKAAIVLDERQVTGEPLSLVDAINATLLNKTTMASLSKNIYQLSKPDAAKKMAEMITDAVQYKKEADVHSK